MVFLSPDNIQKIKEFGYKFSTTEFVFKIHNRSTPSHVLSAFLVLIGIVLIQFAFGEFKIVLLGLMLVFVSIINFRKNLSKIIVFDFSNYKVTYSSGFWGRKQTKDLSEIAGVAMYEYDRSSHTSAFEEGNRDYFVDLCIQWNDNKETELFHFKRRSPHELTFTKPLVKQLSELFKILNHNQADRT